MYGLAKVAAEYASREDDLINNISNSSAKRHSLEASVDPSTSSQMTGARIKHLLAGTGIGTLGGGLAGVIAGSGEPAAALGGAMLGGVFGAATGAITGSVKADNILLQKDPHLYHEIQNAKTEEFLAHMELERHHDYKNMYAQPQQHQVYHYQGK